MTRREVIRGCALAAVISLGAASGCESLGASRREASPTGGTSLSLDIRKPDQQIYELYRVTDRGQIEFGGGMAAFNGSTTWTGTLSEQEIERFLVLLAESGWCERKPESDPTSNTRVQVEAVCASGRRTFSVRGEPESVQRMRAFLDHIARRRFEPELDRLPEATERRELTRGAAPAPEPAPEPSGAGDDARDRSRKP